MKVIFHGNGIVWDPDRQKPLCEFKDGVVALDDERAIAVMRRNGFVEDAVMVDKEPDSPVLSSMIDDVRIVSSIEMAPTAMEMAGIAEEPKKAPRKPKASKTEAPE